MSIRSNFTGTLQVPCVGGPGAGNPISFSAWFKIVGRVGGFGSIITYEDSLFNTAPFFGTHGFGTDIIFSGVGGTNITILNDATEWSYVACSWSGVSATMATAFGLSHDGLWTKVVTECDGVNTPEAVFIGGRTIGSGTTSADADVLYRGVHVWSDKKSDSFLMQQSAQLAPLSEANLYSTLWPYDLSTAQLGSSMAGRPWNATAGGGWTTSPDAPPRPEIISRKVFAFMSRPGLSAVSIGANS